MGGDVVINRLNKFYGFYIFFVILLVGATIPLQAMESVVDFEALEEVEEETKTIEESEIIRLIKYALLEEYSLDVFQELYERGTKDKYVNEREGCDLLDCCLFLSKAKFIFDGMPGGIERLEIIEFFLKSGLRPGKDFADKLVYLWRGCSSLNEIVGGKFPQERSLSDEYCGLGFDMLMRGKDRDTRDKAIDVFKCLEQEEQLVLKPYIFFDDDYKAMLALMGGSYGFTGLSGSIVLEIAEFLVNKSAIDSNIRSVCRAENGVEERRLLGRSSASLLASVALIKRCNKDEKREQEVAAAKKQLLEVETSQDFLVSPQIQENKILKDIRGCRYPLID